MMTPAIDSATGDTIWIDPDGKRNRVTRLPKGSGSEDRDRTGGPPRESMVMNSAAQRPSAMRNGGVADTVRTEVMNYGFEGNWPTGWSWIGYPGWDRATCRPFSGSYSAWCAAYGASCTGNYPDGIVSSWMTSPAVDCSNSYYVDAIYLYNSVLGTGDDFLFGYSLDGETFFHSVPHTNDGLWYQKTIRFLPSGCLRTLCVSWMFHSDASGNARGSYVDGVRIERVDVPTALPDLRCQRPAGWDAQIVVSGEPGTHVSTSIYRDGWAYIDVAWENSGTNCAFTHTARVTVSRGQLDIFTLPATLAPGYSCEIDDIPWFVTEEGQFTITLDIDPLMAVLESDESNNSCQRTLTVSCQPGNASGTGCTVTGYPLNRIDVRTACNGLEYELADWTRLDWGHGILTYRFDSFWDGLPGQLMEDADNIWENSNQCPGVDAHYFAGLTFDYMKTWLLRNGFDDSSGNLVTTVDGEGPLGWSNPTCEYNSLFYWPEAEQVVACIPSVGRRSFAGCLDAVAHEWGHGITHHTSNLVSTGETGALAESFSDMLGVSVGFWTLEDPDWLLGEDSYVGGDFLRDLQFPERKGQPVVYLTDPNWYQTAGCVPSAQNDFCGIHQNSGVPNKMFSLLAGGGTFRGFNVSGIGVQNAMRVMYVANRDHWTSNADFFQALTGSALAANDLDASGAWAAEVRKAWAAVGVCDCPRQGDVVNNDWAVDVFDVIQEIAIAFSGGTDIQDAGCPTTRGDVVNRDFAVDVFDVTKIIAVAMSGEFPDDPCAP